METAMKREVRIMMVRDIMEYYKDGTFENITGLIEEDFDLEKQAFIMSGIFENVPCQPIVLVAKHNEQNELKYEVIQSKGILEQIIDYILKKEREKGVPFKHVNCFDSEEQRRAVLSYTIPVHYISSELTVKQKERINQVLHA